MSNSSKTQQFEISVIIATFNSAKILPKVLEGLSKQTFPKEQMEILILDGGSTDTTYSIAEKYKCKVIDNPKTEPVYAKFLGYQKARGRYIVYLDHDEVLENPKSLELKHAIFKKNSKIKAVIGSGYKNPKGYPVINNYINEFGDPFSAFIYNLSKDSRFFLKQMKKKYLCITEEKEYAIFDLSKIREMPIIELCAAASMLDGIYMKKVFPETLKNPSLIPHFFYLLNSKQALIAITKNDALVHYSSETLSKYLNKIKWRIKNNIYHKFDMGESGFTGREKYSAKIYSYKKYFFLPYVYSVVFCLIDAFKLAVTRKNIFYLIHFPLCIYTANTIVYNMLLKILGNKPQLKSYDEKKIAGSRTT